MNVFEQILLLIVAFVANLFSAFSGGGAGLLQLPALIFLGLPFAIALATHKLASVALGVGATARHLKSSRLERQFALFMLFTGVPGVIVGANIILLVPDRNAEIALGILTLGLGVYSGLKRSLGQTHDPQHRDRKGMVVGGLMLFVIGGLNGSLTSGTGLFVTLWLVRWFGMDYQRAVAYTLILVGSLLGGYLGAHMAIKFGNRWIKRVFEIVTIAVGLKLIIG